MRGFIEPFTTSYTQMFSFAPMCAHVLSQTRGQSERFLALGARKGAIIGVGAHVPFKRCHHWKKKNCKIFIEGESEDLQVNSFPHTLHLNCNFLPCLIKWVLRALSSLKVRSHMSHFSGPISVSSSLTSLCTLLLISLTGTGGSGLPSFVRVITLLFWHCNESVDSFFNSINVEILSPNTVTVLYSS